MLRFSFPSEPSEPTGPDSIRKMTPEEVAQLHQDLRDAGAVGQNVVRCSRCHKVVRESPNIVTPHMTFANNLLEIPECDDCAAQRN